MCRRPLERRRSFTNHRLLTHQPRRVYQRQASLQLTSRPNSTIVMMAEIAASPSSASVSGATTSRVVISRGSLIVALVREAPAVHAVRPPSSPGLSGGCMALAPHIHVVVWPRKFRPHLSEKYDGTVNSIEFLRIYSTSILAAGGDEAIMANYIPVALTGTTRSWLMNLPKGTLTS
jgi:hypothetical protein